MSAPTDTAWGYCELCNGSFGDDELYLKLVPLIVSGQRRQACIAQFCIRCVTRARRDSRRDRAHTRMARVARRRRASRGARHHLVPVLAGVPVLSPLLPEPLPPLAKEVSQMPSGYRFGDSQGPRVSELKGRLCAIRVIDVELDKDTKHGTKDAVHADVFEIILPDGRVDHVGEMTFVQDVLSADLIAAHKADEWTVARLIRPERAWLFEPPPAHEHEIVDRAMAELLALVEVLEAEPAPAETDKPADDGGEEPF